MNMITLHHNCPVRLVGPLRIECVAGIVWLTRTGGAGDIFLQAGESLLLRRGESALGEALRGANVALYPAPTLWAWGTSALAAVLSWAHEHVRTLRISRRRTPVAG
jgi:hypothetical protein